MAAGGAVRGIDNRSGNSQGARWPVLPFLGLLGIGAVVIVGLIVAAARGQDMVARKESTELAQALVAAQMRDLARISKDYASKDYAWWDEAAANIGHGLNRSFGITESMVLDSHDRVVFRFRDGEPVAIGPTTAAPSGFAGLIEAARQAPGTEPAAVAGMTRTDDRIQMAAAALITPTAPAALSEMATETGAARQPYLLLFVKALDPQWLARTASDYGFDGLSVVPGEIEPGQPSLPLLSTDGSRLGALVWNPETPGETLLWTVLPPVGAAFALIGLLSLVILRQIDAGRRENERNLAVIAAKNEELETLAALQHATLDSINEGISVFDRDLRLVIWNRTYAEMHGYPDGLLRPGTSLVDILRFNADRGDYNPQPPDEIVAERLSAALRCDRMATEHVRPNGRVLELRRNPMPCGGFVNSYRDISERKRAEQELVTARDQAQLANRAKTEFLANVSHELRTPLNAILGFSEIMKEELFGPLGSDTYRGYIRDIHLSGSVLLDLINDILDLSKIEAGKFELYEEEVDIGELFAAALRIIRARAEAADLSIAVEIDRRLPKIKADKRALKQILLNLLSNAVKFTPSGGRITLRAERDGDGAVQLSVADTGIGIAAEDIPRAMAVFGQVDSRLARRYNGTGLGLPLSRALTELHHGTLQLASEPGVGTAVSVRLPVDRVAA